MPASKKRLLIITTQLKFSGALKKSLESTGEYRVTAFTSPEAAVKFARAESIDLVLVDFNMDMAPPVAVVKALRKLHPNLALIVGPATSETLSAVKDLNVQAVVDIPITARELLPLLSQALQDVQKTETPEPKPAKPRIAPDQPAPKPEIPKSEAPKSDVPKPETPKPTAPPPPTPSSKTTFEENLKDMGGIFEDGTSTLQVDMSDVEDMNEPPPDSHATPIIHSQVDAPPPKPPAPPVAHPEDKRTAEEKLQDKHDSSLFKRLEADEPPLPTLSEGGTVTDLRASVLDTGMRRVVEILSANTKLVEPITLSEDDGDPEIPNLARAILRDSVEQTSSLDALQAAGYAAVEMDDDEVEELESELGKSSPIKTVEDEPQPPPKPTTLPGQKTEKPEPPRPTVRPPSKPATLPSSKQTPAKPPTTPSTQEGINPEQLAVLLTQASLELTAEATLLARGGEIVALAGQMHENDVREIGKIIDNDWTANADQSRIRFVNLPGNGMDYMLYTQRTQIDDALSLTMIFAGNMPLKVIRRQSNRLLEALNDVPDVPAVEHIEDEEVAGHVSEMVTMADQATYDGEMMAHSYIWLLHQDIADINVNTAQILVTELRAYLSNKMWEVHTLDVEEDYIYLYASIPGEPVAHEIIRKLKDRSARIIRKQRPELTGKQIWADAYLTLVPGREMSIDEIQRFIRFGRM